MTCWGGESGANGPVDVGSMAECHGTYDVMDLSGNVWEWENACAGSTGENDQCYVRGGGFASYETDLRCASNASQPHNRNFHHLAVGFRCCAAPLP